MGKYGRVLGGDDQEPRRRRRGPWLALLVVALAVSSPVLFEGGRIVVARWQGMLGSHHEVPTPVLDKISEVWWTAGDELKYRAPALLHTGHWSPAMAVPAVIAMALFGSLFLRRGPG
jgi:hypothetical protein